MNLDPSQFHVDNWPSAVVLVVFLLVVVGLPSYFGYKRDQRVKRVEKTLTVNGGKSNPPTVLDRLHALDQAVTRVEGKVDAHLDWSDGFQAQVDQRLAKVETDQRHAAERPKRFGLF